MKLVQAMTSLSVCKFSKANPASATTCHVPISIVHDPIRTLQHSISIYMIQPSCYSQGTSGEGFLVSPAQRAAPGPPAVLPRVAVAAPAPWQAPMPSWHANSSAVVPTSQQYGYDEQQASGSQDSSSHFRFLPGQGTSQDSQSTPSLSNRSVPKFLEESWARGEPQQGAARQAQAPPVPPAPPGRTSLALPLLLPAPSQPINRHSHSICPSMVFP